MERKQILIAGFLIFILFLPTLASAAAQVTISTTVEKQENTENNGDEIITYVATESGTPGEILRFTLSYQNKGNEVAEGVMINNPIPAGTIYLTGSATSKGSNELSFSIDNGVTFNSPEQLTYQIKKPDGSFELKIASPDKYTNIRWKLQPIAAGAAGNVFFKVQIK